MDSKHHALAKELFGEVCDLPETERHSRLRKLTSDTGIIEYVELLLRQTDTDHPRVSQPVLRMMSVVAGDDVKMGETLGAWRLVSEIGQGGMGTVFRAERSDGHFEQEAAVKLLHGIPSAKSLEYLARERQILATLTHPNIARLYDGGTTPHGQPYLVMEYVEGIAIDRYVRDKHLPVHDILKLMIDVCGAISFAHQRLIVHCDIKPSNILITTSGRPVLLDFGIARLLDGEARNEPAPGAPVTGPASKQTMARAFTPQYASPEQRNGQVLTTATDVYSLGRMLRELLEITNTVGSVNAKARQGLNSELRAITNKAVEEDPANRYASAVALAADLECYLGRKPIDAVKATPAYVARKFSQRNWPWLVAAGVFALTVGAAAQRIVSERDRAQSAEQQALKERDATQSARADALRERDGAQAARTEAEHDRDRVALAEQATAKQRDRAQSAESAAVEERDRARVSEATAVAEKNRATQAEASTRQTSDFLISVFDSSNPNAESGDIPASKLIAAAEARLEKQMQGQPETQALLYSALARVQSNMGKPKEARENVRRAIEIERKQNRPLELARMLTLEFQNDVLKLDNSQLVPLAREALALREQTASGDSEELAQSLGFMAYALRATSGDLREAERLLVRAMAIHEKIDPTSLGNAETLHIAGQVYGVLGQREKAIESYRRSIDIKQRKLAEGHPDVLISLQYLAGELNRSRQFAEAEIIFRRIVSQNEKLHGRQNVNMLRPLIYLAALLTATGRPRDALQLGQEALQIAERTVGRDSTYAALAMNSIGLAQADLGDNEIASQYFREALGIMKKYMRPIDNAVATQEMNLGRTLTRLGKPEESHVHLLAAYEIYRKVLGEAHRETAAVVAELIRCAITADKLTEAAMWQARLKPAVSISDPEVNADIAMVNAMLAAKQGDASGANSGFVGAEKRYRDLYGDADARSWLAMLPRTEWLASRGQREDYRQSRALAAQILANVRDRLSPNAPVIAQLKALQQ